MGKYRRSRQADGSATKSRKVKPLTDPDSLRLLNDTITPAMQALQSTNHVTRLEAAGAISKLLPDPMCRKLLLREQIVQLVMTQMLVDPSLEVRNAGWAITKGVAVHEDDDFCTFLFRMETLPIVEDALKRLMETLSCSQTISQDLQKDQMALVSSYAENVTRLLARMCQSSEEITNTVSKAPSLISYLVMLLGAEMTTVSVQEAALSCLSVLTEVDVDLVEMLASNADIMQQLFAFRTSSEIVSVLASSTIHNIYVLMEWYDHNAPDKTGCDFNLLDSMAGILDRHRAELQDVEHCETEALQTNPSSLQRSLNLIATIATEVRGSFRDDVAGSDTQMQATHVRTRSRPDLGQSAMNGGKIDGSSGEEMGIEAIDADMSMILDDNPTPSSSDMRESPTLQALVQQICPRLIAYASAIRTATHSRYGGLEEHVLAAINNIAWSVSDTEFSNTTYDHDLQAAWCACTEQIWLEVVRPVLLSDTADIELAETITSIAWAVSRSMKSKLIVTPREYQRFMALYRAAMTMPERIPPSQQRRQDKSELNDPFQGLGVKCIGILSELAKHPAPVDTNREIGVFLMTIVENNGSRTAEVVEALNQIFEIYGDKLYAFDHQVFWQDDFYKHLEDALPRIKRIAKSVDKRKLPELRTMADEVVMNLPLFLKYKRDERSA